MPRRNTCTGFAVTSSPSMVMRPPDGSIILLIIRRVVVLTQPDDPTRTVISPVANSIDKPSTAVVPSAKRLVTSSNRITGSTLAVGPPGDGSLAGEQRCRQRRCAGDDRTRWGQHRRRVAGRGRRCRRTAVGGGGRAHRRGSSHRRGGRPRR